jgi:transposase
VLNLGLPVQVYLCVLPTDMRRGFDGLMRMAEEHLQRNVLDGGLFVFINRRRDRIKLLYWDSDGLAIWYKKLEPEDIQILGFTEVRWVTHNRPLGPSEAGQMV